MKFLCSLSVSFLGETQDLKGVQTLFCSQNIFFLSPSDVMPLWRRCHSENVLTWRSECKGMFSNDVGIRLIRLCAKFLVYEIMMLLHLILPIQKIQHFTQTTNVLHVEPLTRRNSINVGNSSTGMFKWYVSHMFKSAVNDFRRRILIMVTIIQLWQDCPTNAILAMARRNLDPLTRHASRASSCASHRGYSWSSHMTEGTLQVFSSPKEATSHCQQSLAQKNHSALGLLTIKFG